MYALSYAIMSIKFLINVSLFGYALTYVEIIHLENAKVKPTFANI